MTRSEWLAVLGALLCAVGIQVVQPPVAQTLKAVHLGDDLTSLPPPQQVRAMSFGYHAATADVLWATLLVEHGLHSQEHRRFEGVSRYFDAIIELEKDHPLVYQFVDTLLVMAKPGAPATADDARRARAYLERGTRERPYDQQTWLHYGQYLAFLGLGLLDPEKDKEEIERWRREGALALGRAVELGADADRSLAAGTLLSKSGEKKAAIAQLQRAFAVTDNPDTRRQIVAKLAKLEASPVAEDAVTRVEYEWRTRYPFLSRGAALLVGPYVDAAACAGPEPSRGPGCPGDWQRATAR